MTGISAAFNQSQGPTPTFPVSAPVTHCIYNGPTLLTPQFAVINASSSGTVIAGNGGYIIRVLAMDLVSTIALTIGWETETGPTLISGPQAFAANGGIVRPLNELGWFQTLPGDALLINLSAGGQVGGNITYVML